MNQKGTIIGDPRGYETERSAEGARRHYNAKTGVIKRFVLVPDSLGTSEEIWRYLYENGLSTDAESQPEA